jgi:hypothetical protein
MIIDRIPISRRLVKPSNCAFAIGLSASRDGFRRDQENQRADFAKRFLGGWEQYYEQFVTDREELASKLRKWGVTVIHDSSLCDFAELFARPFDVVILFSHWSGDSVEFRGGLEGVSAILAAIPPAFDGILDLCVCHPDPLARALSVHRPQCLVKHTPIEAAPEYWFRFYGILFSQLHTRELTYLAAMEEVAGAFLDSALGKRAGR